MVVVTNQSKNLSQMDFSPFGPNIVHEDHIVHEKPKGERREKQTLQEASLLLKARFKVCEDLNLRPRLWSSQPPTAPQPLSWKTAAHMNAFSRWDHSLIKHPLPFLAVGSTDSSSANHCPNLLLGALFLPAIPEGGIQSGL